MNRATLNPLFLGSDHAGFKLKEEIKSKLKEAGYEIIDLSPEVIDPQDDYPEIAEQVAKKVLTANGRGVLFCGSGNGVCLAANKIKGIRAALGYNIQAAKWSKTDENANILCLAGLVLNPDYAFSIVKHWLETAFSGEERHKRRIKKIKQLENL